MERRERRRKDERGAIALFVVLIMGVSMGVAALVVDLGMERVTRADLQALADVTALDLAREIRDGRTQADLAQEGDLNVPTSAVSESVARNPDVFGVNLSAEVDWGSYVNSTWDSAPDPPTAVRVSFTAEADYAVMPGSGVVTREAYAVASSTACYRLGSFGTAIRSADSTVVEPLNRLLGVSLSLATYQVLTDADVTIGDLAGTSRFGGPAPFLAGTVTFADLVSGVIEVLSRDSASNGSALNALGAIRSGAGSMGTLAVADVLHVAPTDSAALDVPLNVLDVLGSARLATGPHSLKVENIQAGVPGVGYQFTGGIALLSGAQVACGAPNSPESVARSSQLEGTLGVDFVNLPSLNVPNVGTLQTGKGTGTLVVDLSDGQGRLVAPPEIHCGAGTQADPHGLSVAVATEPGVFSLATLLSMGGEVQVGSLQDLGLSELLKEMFGEQKRNDKVLIEMKTRLDVTNHAGGTEVVRLQLPPNDVVPVQTGRPAYLDPSNVVPTVTDVALGGRAVSLARVAPLSNAIAAELTTSGNAFVSKTLVPLIDNINNKLVGPATRMVGTRFGGADVYALDVVCATPALRG